MTRISSAGRALKKNKPLGVREKGFTLIELIAVIVMIGLLLGLVTPMVMTTLDRIQSDSSVRKIVSMLASARSQAVASKTSYVFQGDLDRDRYWVTDPATEDSSEVIQLDRMIQFQEFLDGETSFSEGIFSVTFYPLGNASGGTILLEPAGAEADAPSFALTIDPVTGKSYLQNVS